MLLTVGAMAVNGGVAQFDNEAVAMGNVGSEGVTDGAVDLQDAAASPTEQVEVVGVVREVIARDAVVDMGVTDQAGLLQGVKGSIHGGRRQGRSAVLRDPGHDLLGGHVAGPLEGGQHPRSLGRQPSAARTQLGPDILHRSTVCRPLPPFRPSARWAG